MTSGFWAFGSKLKLGDGATSETFTTIAEVKDINAPKMSKDSVEMTNQDSSGGWREFLPGLKDGGEVSFDANWLPNNATQDDTTGLFAKFTDNVNHNWQIVLPDGTTTVAFAGHVTAFEPELPYADGAKLSCTIKISGPVTY